MLGVNWLQLVNPVVDWSGGKVYLPNAAHTALLQGDWLEDHVKSGTVTVLAGIEELSKMNESMMQNYNINFEMSTILGRQFNFEVEIFEGRCTI